MMRRQLLQGTGGAVIAGVLREKGGEARAAETLAADLDRYIAFGIKLSGGPGDRDCGRWLEQELRAAGFATTRQDFPVPGFDLHDARLTTGADIIPVIPAGIVVPTGPAGLTAPLAPMSAGQEMPSDLAGAIALVDLPHARWSSMNDGTIRTLLPQLFAADARAVLFVTHGPTGKAAALNCDARASGFGRPVATIAPDRTAPLRTLTGAEATLVIDGEAKARTAFNLAGRIDRGKGRWLVVSTPRSGWTVCAGERGPGIASWLALARWAPAALPDHDLLFLCNSGHECENLGAAHTLAANAPAPDATAFWLHLGANVAARDWHDLGGGRLSPLPSADSQRFLLASERLVDEARAAFVGLMGLEMAYPVGPAAAGELATIAAAGYPSIAGIFGAHRFHHIAEDDARCVDARLIEPVVQACKRLIFAAIR